MTVAVKCARCGDYELVEPRGGGMLEPCPDCGPELVMCPVHRQGVITRDGHVVGKCWDCSNEAANALKWLRTHPYRDRRLA